VLLVALALVGCREPILHDLSEHEANKVVSRLHAHEVQASKIAQSDGRWAIEVPSQELMRALEFLDSHRVLAGRGPIANVSSKGSFVPSREEQWFRYERSVATSIEESMAAIQGVLEAKVHVNLPEVDPLFGSRSDDHGSGSVLLLVDHQFEAKNDEIAALVAGASGIPANTITVLVSLARQDDSLTREAKGVAGSVIQELRHEGDFSASALSRRVVYGAGIVVASFVGFVGLIAYLRHRWRRRVKFALPDGVGIEV